MDAEGPTETQKRIMDAALDLFADQGFKATTTREIAIKAGVNELTIFRNFGNKENLFRETIAHNMDMDMIEKSFDIGRSGDVEKDIKAVVRVIRKLISEKEKLFRVMLREHANSVIIREKLNHYPFLVKKIVISKVMEILGPHMKEGMDPETASVFLGSYFLRNEMMNAILGKDPFTTIDDRTSDQVVDIFLHGVLKEELRS